MVQIKINGDKIFKGKKEGDIIFIDEQPMVWDISETGKNSFHIIRNNLSYRAELIFADWENKSLRLKINHSIIDVSLQDKYDLLTEKLGLDKTSLKNLSDVKAPMPGMIVQVYVKEGDEVKQGDALIILEAMKMENIIKAGASGIVRSVHTHVGESVEKNQVLIRF